MASRPRISRDQEVAETAGKFRDLKTFARIGEHHLWQIRGTNRLRGKNPEIEIMPGEPGKAIAQTGCLDLRNPSASRRGLPLQSNCVRGRQKDLGLDRQAIVSLFQKALPRSLTGTVEVIIRSQTVIENDAAVVIRIGVRQQREQAEDYREDEKMAPAGAARSTSNTPHSFRHSFRPRSFWLTWSEQNLLFGHFQQHHAVHGQLQLDRTF
jgi:hypothetical protein